jgi:hypothetical protein
MGFDSLVVEQPTKQRPAKPRGGVGRADVILAHRSGSAAIRFRCTKSFPRQSKRIPPIFSISFPNSKYDDQVDSTVFAIAWSTLNRPYGWTDESIANLGQTG